MRKLVAYNALNLDSGSTTSVIEVPDGSLVALNRPPGSTAGTQRWAADHSGVFAQRLTGKR